MRCWLLTQQVAFGMELNSAIQRHRRELSAVLKCRWLGQAGVGNRSQGRAAMLPPHRFQLEWLFS